MTNGRETKTAALITGGAKRIGAAITRELARAGHPVAIHYNGSQAAAAELATEIAQSGGTAAVFGADLSDRFDVEDLVKDAEAMIGPIGVLVNNASIFEHDDLATMDMEALDRQMQVNLYAPLQVSQAFALRLPKGMKGNIINLVDQRVWRPGPDFLSYGLSKNGLWWLTQVLAQSLAPAVRVNAIGPGPVLPNQRQSQEDFDLQAAATPLTHGASPEEIGRAVRFILTSPAMTGQMIALDGGQHLDWRIAGQEAFQE